MRLLRSALVTAATAAVATVAAAMPATAAPPIGCYGLPSVPAAFVCVVSFTPGEALPGASSVTVPAVCAGDCYGPFTVGIPSGGSGSGRVAVVTYNGNTYGVVVGQFPDIPDVPDLVQPITFQDCPGTPFVATAETSPFLCVHRSGTGIGSLYVGTCLTAAECTGFEIPLRDIAKAIVCLADLKCQ